MKKLLLTALIAAYSFSITYAENYYDVVTDGIYYKLEQFSPIDDRIIACVCSEYEYGSNDYKPSYFGSVVIPEQIEYDGNVYDVIEVSHNAFRDCTELNEVILPSSILRIAEFAFRNCGNLKLSLPSVSYMGYMAFYDTFLMDCDSSKLTYLENWAFAGLRNKSITLGESIEFFGSYMFEDSDVEEVVFIESDATATKHVLFPTCAFAKSKLKEIRLPKRDLKLSIGFINSCPDLERVIFPDVDYIEPTNFVQTVMPTLEGCLIKDSENLISESPNLKEIVSLNSTPILFRKGLMYLEESVLDDYSKCVLKVPAGSEDAYRADPTWGKFKHIEGFQPGEYVGVENVKRDDDANANTQVRKLFADEQGIHIELPEPCVAEIYNLAGTLVCRAEHPGGTFRTAVPQGVYLLRTTKY